MNLLREQVIDSYQCAYDVCPRFAHPKDLFTWLKSRVKYTDDPPGNELIQSMQTLFFDNKHGRPGAGDCDCFTVSALACMMVQGWENPRIYLTSRTRKFAQHIYAGVKFRGREYIFDLTNPRFDTERQYPYKQKLEL